jgi:hypothetical protein
VLWVEEPRQPAGGAGRQRRQMLWEEVGSAHRAERVALPARALRLEAGDGASVVPVKAGGKPHHLLLRRR